jgi:hypothetical protein
MSSEDTDQVYVLEKPEISIDEDDDGYEYDEIKDSDDELDSIKKFDTDDSDELEDFNRLKDKSNKKKIDKETMGADGTGINFNKSRHEVKPKVIKRDVVIDDYIRNYFNKFGMNKSLNIFQLEWSQLQKKGVFNDNHIGLITDTENKN